MSFFDFHPVIERWFLSRFEAPTDPQVQGWPHIATGKHTLIAAPTGSGKTLTAFLSCIDRLLKDSLNGSLEEGIRVVYISPLRALSNDMHRNLSEPLQEITELAEQEGFSIPGIRAGLRTGDTSPSQRTAIVKKPPHILVTTPESLYLMLTSPKAREVLRTVETVIVDEIHALIRDKRGSHLSLTLERLEALCGRRLQRVGLSATQKPIEQVADFLTGKRNPKLELTCLKESRPEQQQLLWDGTDEELEAGAGLSGEISDECAIVNVGHGRELDLAILTPPSELGAVCMHEQWEEVNEQLVELINTHRSTLIFVNTRRMAERVTHQLTELLGEEVIGSHHGSLAADIRQGTEQGLKTGKLKAVVATASLELGLDIGYIDLVIQLGSPRSIAAFLQRIGRSGHSLGLIPKGRLFALTRDELMECMGLIRAVKSGRLDLLMMPKAPLDILAQQIVAEVALQDWNTDELFDLFTQAEPYRDLSRKEFNRTIHYLSEGITQEAGRSSRVYLHHDHVNKTIRARKGAKLTALTNGGAIPEIASYRVVAEPDNTVVGTLDEEFAVESQRGDVFLLGNCSWRILYVRGGDVTVADAHGAPPTVPFWQGEAPGRTLELSEEVSRLREDLEPRLEDPTVAKKWLMKETHCDEFPAEQMIEYCAAQKAAIGLLPTQKRVVFERFFDETGGMQLVVHAPFGAGITKAWGFSMRKRFCRSFDFELQATADDDGFILSLGPQHSFPIESLFPMLTSENARSLLEQAMFQVPLFQVRWRWNVTRALLVMRMNKGKKVPPPLQRFRADDLLTAVFPKLTGCQEEHTGDHELPDHPLAIQTMEDCLFEAVHIEGLNKVLDQISADEIQLIARDTREPSPFTYELLNANPYAFLDGGEAQERRARAVATRRSLSVESVNDLGRLDLRAIEQVIQEATPLVRDADELHDALLSRIVLPVEEATDWKKWYRKLEETQRACTVTLSDGRSAWAAAERLPAVLAAFPDANPEPMLSVPETVRHDWNNVDARLAMIRGLLETCGPMTATTVSRRLSLTLSQTEASLVGLEAEGVAMRGHFTPNLETDSPSHSEENQQREKEWCHRRLLARIHRLTLDGLRKQIEPVSVKTFVRFLTRYHGVLPGEQRSGTNGAFEVISLLQGIDIPAISWEQQLLPARLEKYQSAWLDELCLTGEVGWGRLFPPARDPEKSRPMANLTRIAPISFWLRSDLPWLSFKRPELETESLSSPAQEVQEFLEQRGAMFANELLSETRMLPTQMNEILGELVTRGQLSADGFSGLRRLIANKDPQARASRRMRPGLARERSSVSTGRWSLWGQSSGSEEQTDRDEQIEQWAWQLLRRWGVIFRDLLIREPGAPSWFELLQVYRRLEARGEIRGGRFITGVAGEQFALGDIVRQLRQLRDEQQAGKKTINEVVVLCAADPLNLVGILTKDPRIPSTASNRVAYLNGEAVAALQGGELKLFRDNLNPELLEQICQRFDIRDPSRSKPTGDTNERPNPKRERKQSYPNNISRPMFG